MDYRLRSTLEAVAAPDASPSPWVGVQEPNINAQTKEATMTRNSGATIDAQTEERTMAERDMTPKKKRNTMKDVSGKINQLRELAKQGRSREYICATLGISRQGFETLRRKLIDIDKVYYDIPHEVADRSGRVGKTGILISADRLLAMGAEGIFAEGTAISIRYEGGEIRIHRADRKNPHNPEAGDASMRLGDEFGAMFEVNAGSECEDA